MTDARPTDSGDTVTCPICKALTLDLPAHHAWHDAQPVSEKSLAQRIRTSPPVIKLSGNR